MSLAPAPASLENFQQFEMGGRTHTAHNVSESYSTVASRGLDKNKFDFEVREGDFWVGDGTAKNRSEIRLTNQQFSDVIWQAQAFKIGQFANDASFFYLGQWHGGDNTQDRSPYLALKLAGNLLRFEYRYATTYPETSAGLSAYSLPDIQRDQWHFLVMQHFVHPTDGFVRGWLNGVLVADYAGPLGYWDEETAGYWKAGIYREASDITAAVSHANIEVGTTDLTARISTPLLIQA